MKFSIASLAATLSLLLAATGAPASTATSTPSPNADVDYQLGGAYPPYPSTEIVSRDRFASPAPGLYNICYVNAFQTQPNRITWWIENHSDLLLQDDGEYVVDGEWGENLFAIDTKPRRQALAAIIRPWVDRCANDGFDAVEFDNLDSWTRSAGLLSKGDAKKFVRLLNKRAANRGLASGQKNTTQLARIGPDLGFSFAIAEECNRYRECGKFTGAYGDNVILIEYRQRDFDRGCARFAHLSIVLRDRQVRPKDHPKHVHDSC